MSNSNIIEQGGVTLAVENDIATIEFSHPAGNSLPGSILRKLADTITATGKNEDVKAIILKSAGERAFCAGASFDELLAIKDSESGKQFFSGFANVINAARKCPKFIIGRVQGKAVGGGVGLASATDFCYATQNASVKLSELSIGIGPFVVGPAVERKIGKSAFSQLAVNAGEWYPAGWAKEKGLYAEVFETVEEMDAAVQKLAQTLATSSPDAMALLKKTFWEGTENWDELLAERAAISGKLALSEFAVNAVNRIREKK